MGCSEDCKNLNVDPVPSPLSPLVNVVIKGELLPHTFAEYFNEKVQDNIHDTAIDNGCSPLFFWMLLD